MTAAFTNLHDTGAGSLRQLASDLSDRDESECVRCGEALTTAESAHPFKRLRLEHSYRGLPNDYRYYYLCADHADELVAWLRVLEEGDDDVAR